MKKKKVEEHDTVLVVNGTTLIDGTAMKVHRHNVDVKTASGGEQEYQIGNVFHHSDRDLAIEKFNSNR